VEAAAEVSEDPDAWKEAATHGPNAARSGNGQPLPLSVDLDCLDGFVVLSRIIPFSIRGHFRSLLSFLFLHFLGHVREGTMHCVGSLPPQDVQKVVVSSDDVIAIQREDEASPDGDQALLRVLTVDDAHAGRDRRE
jgi:hypothetical protein